MNDPAYHSEIITRLHRLGESVGQERLQSDAELLSLYVDGGNRVAAERLIRRYAPMVASVCRLTVSDVTSAEDAFQATFLIFLKSARKIRHQASLAAWLHGVAYRTASRLRKKRCRDVTNLDHDEVSQTCSEMDEPIAQLARKMELEALDRELERLPDRLRGPLVEHYLLGYTAPQIAERMELSISAVEGRIRRGRRRLRTMLAKRGISLSVLAAGSGLFQQHLQATEAVDWTMRFLGHHLPGVLADAPVTDTGVTEIGGPASLNPEISSLVHGELSMIGIASLKASLAVGMLVVAGVFAVVAAGRQPTANGSSALSRSSDAHAHVLRPADMDREPEILAQFGGGQPAGLNASANSAQAGGSEDSTAPASSAVGMGGGEMSDSRGMMGMGGFASNMGSAMGVSDFTAWQQPDSNENEKPTWLAGGEASTRVRERNRAVLSQEVEFEFSEVPLSNFAEWLTENTGLQFELSVPELDLLGVDPDEPVSIRGRGSVKELLRRILDSLELTYRVTESTIEITSVDAADAEPSIRFYDLSYVLPNNSNLEALVNAIQQSADPDCWMAAGGTSSIVVVGSTMIVATRETTHQKIELILMNLTKMDRRNLEQAAQGAESTQGGPGGMF